MEKYTGGFTVRGKHPIETEEWTLSEKYSNEGRLVFLGYDANLYPMPNFSERPNNKISNAWKEKVIERALEYTKDFNGEVWLDDVKVKE